MGSDMSGSWRPACHRQCLDSLFKVLRCDSGIFLPLIKRQTSPSSSLLKNHKCPPRFEWEKQGHSSPFDFISSSCCVWERLATIPEYLARAGVAWGQAVIPLEQYFEPV